MTLFENSRTKVFYKTHMVGSVICITSFPKEHVVLVEEKSLPLVLHMQMDNYLKGNKCRYAFYWWQMPL